MKRRALLQAGLAGPLALSLPACATPSKEPKARMSKPVPPVAKKEPKRIEQLGRVRTDDYAWMRDDNWQTVLRDPATLKPDVTAYLNAENAYLKEMMAPTEPLQAALFAEMRGRMKEEDSTVPDPDGPWEYYARYATGAEHPVLARRPRPASPSASPAPNPGPEQVLIDVDAAAKGKAYYKVGASAHSPDHALFAYAVDAQGSEVWRVYVKDLASGAVLENPIEDCYGAFVFSPDSRHLFWVYRDANGRPAKVFRRPVRGGPGDDTLVYEEPDDGFFLTVEVTESRAYILITSANQETSEVRTIPGANPTAAPALFHPREPKLLYTPTHWDGAWRILTNADGAVDFKVMTAQEGATGRAQWKPFIAHKAGTFIEGLAAFREHLVRLERVNALPRLVIRERASGAEHAIEQAEEAFALSLDGGYEYDTKTLRYVYTSPTTPRQWVDYDMGARTKTVRKTQEVPSGHDPAAYVARRLFAPAPDGAQVPVTVLMRRDIKLDGSAPLLLYGYGSYGIPQEASFSIRALSLVDRGWIYALAHTRGGSDKGFGWFLDGRGFNKKNTFTDFIACAEYLTAQGYGRKGAIVAYGGSAGGMLMGAVANMAPELWAGVIGAVPFVDVLNTMSDETLPLTPPEWPEWGNPLTDPAAYDYIASYSPYDNISAKAYPAILATGGLSDPRVTYWEPAKWAAKLRENTTSGRPILLKINMQAGHAGAAGRFDFLKEIAVDYAFALKAVGAAEAGGGF